MKESYDEGLASHIGPESCGISRPFGTLINREVIVKRCAVLASIIEGVAEPVCGFATVTLCHLGDCV